MRAIAKASAHMILTFFLVRNRHEPTLEKINDFLDLRCKPLLGLTPNLRLKLFHGLLTNSRNSETLSGTRERFPEIRPERLPPRIEEDTVISDLVATHDDVDATPSFPTESRMKQKEKEKIMKEAGIQVTRKKKPQTVEYGGDDCGGDSTGIDFVDSLLLERADVGFSFTSFCPDVAEWSNPESYILDDLDLYLFSYMF